MNRASFTVRTKKGVSYDANHVTITVKNCVERAGKVGAISMISFVSSGELTVLEATEIEEIEFHPSGAFHCSECDGSIWDHVGVDIYANPENPEK